MGRLFVVFGGFCKESRQKHRLSCAKPIFGFFFFCTKERLACQIPFFAVNYIGYKRKNLLYPIENIYRQRGKASADGKENHTE